MLRRTIVLQLSFVLFTVTVCSLCHAQAPRPKVIITTLIDDFGYASASFNRDAGSTPWETRTPNIDALASEGVIFHRFYMHSFCSPSRASFLSGRLPMHVQHTNIQPDQTTAGIPINMTTLPEFLRLAHAPVDCHVVGKYDVGAATFGHSPEGRGFNSSLIYFSHAVDYWSQNDYCGPNSPPEACTCDDQYVDLWDTGFPARTLNGTGFVDDLFLERVLQLIAGHDYGSNRTLWIHYNTHVTHDPLQVPPAFLAQLANTTDDESACNASIAASATGGVYPGAPTDPALYRCRRTFEAMVAWLDSAFGRIRSALDAVGVWEDTLLIASSDNGGQAMLEYGGGSNFPLRGGKGSDWEGGIRVAAFASGGFLPAAARGRVEDGLVHGCDWLATLCGLLTGDATLCMHDARAQKAGLPGLDSLDLWPLLSGANTTSPRTEVAVSLQTLVTTRYKLILGRMSVAGWDGPLFPNTSSPTHDVHSITTDCGAGGCLFDLMADPGEHTDLAPVLPKVAAELRMRLAKVSRTFYSNSETDFICQHNASLELQKACACDAAQQVYGGYFGPYARPHWSGSQSGTAV